MDLRQVSKVADDENANKVIQASKSDTADRKSFPATSDWKEQLMNTRIKQRNCKYKDLKKQLQEAKSKVEAEEDKVKYHRLAQEQGEQELSSATKRLADLDEAIGEAQAKITEAQAKKTAETVVIGKLQKDAKIADIWIAKAKARADSAKTAVVLLEETIRTGEEDMRAKAIRQADILYLNPAEIQTLADHAKSNKEFAGKLSKAATGIATPAMKRVLKSALFDKLTGNSEQEFKVLMQKILAKAAPSCTDETIGDSKGKEPKLHESSQLERKAKANPGVTCEPRNDINGKEVEQQEPIPSADKEKLPHLLTIGHILKSTNDPPIAHEDVGARQKLLPADQQPRQKRSPSAIAGGPVTGEEPAEKRLRLSPSASPGPVRVPVRKIGAHRKPSRPYRPSKRADQGEITKTSLDESLITKISEQDHNREI